MRAYLIDEGSVAFTGGGLSSNCICQLLSRFAFELGLAKAFSRSSCGQMVFGSYAGGAVKRPPALGVLKAVTERRSLRGPSSWRCRLIVSAFSTSVLYERTAGRQGCATGYGKAFLAHVPTSSFVSCPQFGQVPTHQS